jgi:hypothetical protein
MKDSHLTHPTTLPKRQASRVHGAAGEMCAQTVAQLVDDNACLEVAISVWEHCVPEAEGRRMLACLACISEFKLC